MHEESKYYSDEMNKHFRKEIVMTKKDDEDFGNATKCWIYDNIYVNSDVKVRGHCHVTGKYRGYVHRGSNITIKLNHKLPIVFFKIMHLIYDRL